MTGGDVRDHFKRRNQQIWKGIKERTDDLAFLPFLIDFFPDRLFQTNNKPITSYVTRKKAKLCDKKEDQGA